VRGIIRRPIFFDILCEHDPPGTRPGDDTEGILRVRCWVRRVAAFDPEEAGRKAERFLTEDRGTRSIRVKRWRFSHAPQEGVEF
jgi:hypothetical protein